VFALKWQRLPPWVAAIDDFCEVSFVATPTDGSLTTRSCLFIRSTDGGRVALWSKALMQSALKVICRFR
jgi:hypothetical protein